MVKKYQVKVIQHQQLVDTIYLLEFESLAKAFKYKPGQFLHLAIDAYDGVGQWPESRCFSMQTSPNNSTLKIIYAAKGSYTTRMAESLNEGDELWLKLPYGSIFQDGHNLSDAIFIAGGTGITPFLSLFTDTAFQQYTNPQLFLGLRERKYNLYQSELLKANEINPDLVVNYFYENENGRPKIEDIISLAKPESCFFISGPPAMISFYKEALLGVGINENKIITDDWE